MRFNFALHSVQFDFKERLSFISSFYVGQIFVGSWMGFEIYKDISVCMGMNIAISDPSLPLGLHGF